MLINIEDIQKCSLVECFCFLSLHVGPNSKLIFHRSIEGHYSSSLTFSLMSNVKLVVNLVLLLINTVVTLISSDMKL